MSAFDLRLTSGAANARNAEKSQQDCRCGGRARPAIRRHRFIVPAIVGDAS